MLDGIDYYPRKKAKSKKSLWLALLVLVSTSTYYIFDITQSSQISDNTPLSITISEPEPEPVEQIELDHHDISVDNKTDNVQLERLDQVIETYRKNQ